MLQIGNYKIEKDNEYTTDTFPRGKPIFNKNDKILVIFDINSPEPTFLHYLKINGKVIMDYYKPSPPNDGISHEYIVEIFSGRNYSNDIEITERNNFHPDEMFRAEDILFSGSFFVKNEKN